MLAKQDKSPAFQWYPKDILTDATVIAMTIEQEGMYRRLLDVCWLEDGLPADAAMLWRLAKCETRDQFDIAWPLIATKFYEHDGRLHNRRLDKERAIQRKNRKKKQLAAHARWDKEQCGRNAPALQMQSPSSSSPSASSKEKKEDRRDSFGVRELLARYQELFLERVGHKPAIERPKDPSLLAGILKQRGFDTAIALIEQLFKSRDPFICGSGYTVGVLSKVQNKLLIEIQADAQAKSVVVQPPQEPWGLECDRLHGGTCGNRSAHDIVMARKVSVSA